MESGLKLRKGGQERIDSVVSSVISMHVGLCKLIPLRVSVPKSLKNVFVYPQRIERFRDPEFWGKKAKNK